MITHSNRQRGEFFLLLLLNLIFMIFEEPRFFKINLQKEFSFLSAQLTFFGHSNSNGERILAIRLSVLEISSSIVDFLTLILHAFYDGL